MSKEMKDRVAVWRIHAFDEVWNILDGFPQDFPTCQSLARFLARWEQQRALALIDGIDSGGKNGLQRACALELEVFYE